MVSAYSCSNFDCKACTWGALELAARYAFVDLADEAYDGGESWDVTVGVNWYWNPNVRVMLNYVHSDTTDFQGNAGIGGTMDVVGVRFEVWW